MTETLPATLPGSIAGRHISAMPLYKVLLYNDDVNTMEHVVRSLVQVFKFEPRECERIMLEAHQNGLALCIVEPLEQAEFHRDRLRSYSLIATIEPE
jgi:ATP-dependent Clp protease adaptor protein ClpS